jgi:hypothetical protein
MLKELFKRNAASDSNEPLSLSSDFFNELDEEAWRKVFRNWIKRLCRVIKHGEE